MLNVSEGRDKPMALEAETANNTASVPKVRITSGPVFDALTQLKAALKEPEKFPRVTIVYANDS